MKSLTNYSFGELDTRELLKGSVSWWIGMFIAVGTAVKVYIDNIPQN